MDLRRPNLPPARPGDLHHDDEAVVLAAIWLRRYLNTIDLAVVRDLRTRFGISTGQAIEAVRLSHGGAYG